MHLLIAFGVCPQTDRHTDFIDENPGAYLLQANLVFVIALLELIDL